MKIEIIWALPVKYSGASLSFNITTRPSAGETTKESRLRPFAAIVRSGSRKKFSEKTIRNSAIAISSTRIQDSSVQIASPMKSTAMTAIAMSTSVPNFVNANRVVVS